MSLLHRATSVESLSAHRRLSAATTSPTRALSPTGSSSNGHPSERTSLLNGHDSSSSSNNYQAVTSGRRLSYSPITTTIPEDKQPVPAFEVSPRKRIAQVLAAVTYCLFGAGVVFGYAAFKPVLISEGVYRGECTPDEHRRGVEVCYKQELRLNFMFTVAAVSTNVAALPIGTILDRYGPRVAGLLGAAFLSAGALLLSFAGSISSALDAYLLGYFALALGGPFIFISSFHLSNAFPASSGLILALLTGAFDSSSAVFLLYRVLYQSTGLSIHAFFLIYLLVPAFVLATQLLLMPRASYQTPSELRSPTEPSSSPADPPVKDAAARSGIYGALHGRSAANQLRTPWFWLIAAFTLVQMLRINYFVATIRTQYAFLLGSRAAAKKINEFFDVALPLGGLVAIPFVGVTLDGLPTAAVLGLLVLFATLIGALGMVARSAGAAYAGVLLFVVYRPFYYTAVSDYSAKVFGFETFGKVYGAIICAAGLFNFAQAGLDVLTFGVFGEDPRPVDGGLLGVAAVVGAALVAFVVVQGRRLRRDRVELEAESARPRTDWVDGMATS